MTFSGEQGRNQKDVQILRDEVRHLSEEMSKEFHVDLENVAGAARELKLVDEGRLQQLAERIEGLIEDLQAMLAELRERAPFTLTSSEAIQIAGTASALDAEINVLAALLAKIEAELERRQAPAHTFIGGAAASAKRLLSKIATILRPIIRSVSARLWRLLVGLMTPKEWSIKGSLGTPVLGLASVELQIAFGPSSGAAP